MASVTNLRQSSTKASAEIVSAALQAGLLSDLDEGITRFEALEQRIFESLNATLQANPEPQSQNNGGKTRRDFTAEQGGELVMKGGKFAKQSIAAIFDMDEKAVQEFGYRGDDGASYVTWLATDQNKNDYTRTAAAAFLAGRKESSE